MNKKYKILIGIIFFIILSIVGVFFVYDPFSVKSEPDSCSKPGCRVAPCQIPPCPCFCDSPFET